MANDAKRFERDSRFELLRIVAMLLIVMRHFCVHGAWPTDSIFSSKITLEILSLGGKLGVDVFVLISGYFLIDSRFKIRSFVRTLGTTLFYSLIIGLFFLLTQPNATSPSMVFQSLLPSGIPWFAATYLGLMLFVPWLNILTKSISQEGYRKLLIVGFISLSLLPTIPKMSFISSSFVWFIFLYFVAGYIKWYGISFIEKHALPTFLACLLVIIAGIAAVDYFSVWNPYLAKRLNEVFGIFPLFLATQDGIILFIASLSLFYWAKHWNVGHSRFINTIASTTFGIYLIHDNVFVRKWLWPHFGGIYGASPIFIIACCLFVSVIVFCVCMVIDYGRYFLARYLSRKITSRKVEEFFASADSWFSMK